ncbi:hypothetical protein DFH06DRAFT_1346119 [Mycena polygramma]|nr:hypothetical protein DFH06DRAFT_1346119 [Mycena polygramma]
MSAPFSLSLHPVPPAFARRRMAEINSELANLKTSITRLEVEHAILGHHLARYIYPVLSLPNEVVSEIFLHTLKPSEYPFADPQSPLFLGHICQRWRDIALSTPSLWTTISLEIDNISEPDSCLRLLDILLTRSRQCPLYVVITEECARHDTKAWLARRFIDAIVPHRRRLQVLRLKVDYADLPNFQSDLPLLRTLHIWPLPYSQPPINASPLFLGAPKLKTVGIHGLHHAMFPFAWDQLTSLFLFTRACLDNVAQILRMACNLTRAARRLRRAGSTGPVDGLPSRSVEDSTTSTTGRRRDGFRARRPSKHRPSTGDGYPDGEHQCAATVASSVTAVASPVTFRRGFVSHYDALNLTELAVQLGRYSWEMEMDDENELPPIPPLLHLKNVDLMAVPTTISAALQRRLLDMLTLPALTRLVVAAPLKYAVVDLVTRSCCPLNTLETRIAIRERRILAICVIRGGGGIGSRGRRLQ